MLGIRKCIFPLYFSVCLSARFFLSIWLFKLKFVALTRRQPHSFFVYKWNISRSLKMKFQPCDGFTKLCQNGELFSIKILTLNGLLSFRTTLNLLKINSLHFCCSILTHQVKYLQESFNIFGRFLYKFCPGIS